VKSPEGETDTTFAPPRESPSSAPTSPPPPPRGFFSRWVPRIRLPPFHDWSSVYRTLVRWVAIAVPIGIVAGLGAALFYFLISEASTFFLSVIGGITLPTEGSLNPVTLEWSSSFPRILAIPAIMTFGGLVVGAVAWRFAPEIEGHGTDAAIHAFHYSGGEVRARVPILKTLVSALTLGTGGTGGREGPVAQIGGGFGSMWSDLVGLSDRERRIALATGLGAGIGAIFRAPLGGAIYAAEIFYTGDFEPDVFVPGIIASVVAYSIYSTIFGFHTLFATPAALASYAFDPARLPLYAVLGIVCGASGILFAFIYHRTETWFAAGKGPAFLRPAAGAAMAGVIFLAAYFAFPEQAHFAALSTLSVGYGFVQVVMLGMLAHGTFTVEIIGVLLAVVFLRMGMTSLVVGSGGSAGLFGTSVVIGAFLGTVIGGIFHVLFPSLVTLPVVAVFSIVGMMSFFGGISKAPLAVLVMVVEMAGSYTVLPAAMISIFVAYVVTGKAHLYEEQLPTRLQSPAHFEEYRDYFRAETPVSEIAELESEVIPPQMRVSDAAALAINRGHAVLSVEGGGEWLGAVRLSDLLAVPPEQRAATPVSDLVLPIPLVLSADQPAAEALQIMNAQQAEVAAVLSTEGPLRIQGLVTRRGLRVVGSSPPTPVT
jgi:chloride channel protein, CIC family